MCHYVKYDEDRFTLVELIGLIVILAVVGGIGYIGFHFISKWW